MKGPRRLKESSMHVLNPAIFRPVRTLVVVALAAATTFPPARAETIEVSRVLVTSISETEVPAREAGVLAEILVEEGEMVEQGTQLAKIDDSEARMVEAAAQLEAAIAEKQSQAEPLIEAAEAAHEVALRNLRRAEESLATFGRSISQSEMDDYRLAATEAKTLVWERRREREIAELQHQLHLQQWELARARSERHAITAPLAGLVKEVHRQRGEWVTPGQPVARILRLDRLRCVGYLDADLARTRWAGGELIGREAILHVPSAADPQARRFTGKVTLLGPEIEPESDQVKIWVEIDNPGLQLRPGDRGTLMIDWPAPLSLP